MQENDTTQDKGPKHQRLNERQRDILQFVQEYIQEHRHPPSTRDIGRGVGISSTSHVAYHINRLVDYGYLAKRPGTSRTVVVLDVGHEQIEEPLVHDSATELAVLRAENRRLREWCRQLERERAWERKQRQEVIVG